MSQAEREVLDVSLADAVANKGVEFTWQGLRFRVRPPSPEEYDDAMFLQRAVQKLTASSPELAALRNQPSSEEDRAGFRALIDDLRRRLELVADPGQQADLQEEINSLETALAKRTLADELAAEKAVLARDRWLASRLLEVWVDEDGTFLPLTMADEQLPMDLLDQARPAIWQVLQTVRLAPFRLDRLRKLRSR